MPAHFTVVRVAGDRELTDDEVLEILERQMTSLDGCEMEISVKATEDQVDKAMRVLMLGKVAEHETKRMRRR